MRFQRTLIRGGKLLALLRSCRGQHQYCESRSNSDRSRSAGLHAEWYSGFSRGWCHWDFVSHDGSGANCEPSADRVVAGANCEWVRD